MNGESAYPGWGGVRWTLAFLTIASVQILSLLKLTRWPVLPEPAATTPPSYVLTLPDARSLPPDGLWPENSLTFALGDAKGFSGGAERHLPRTDYNIAEWRERPRWLAPDLALQRLGRPPAPQAARIVTPTLPVPRLPVTPEPARLTRLQNDTRVEDGLAGRTLVQPPQVAFVPAEALREPLVDIGVNRWGQVIVARLRESSGSPEADAAVLAASRTARFAPLDGRVQQHEQLLTELDWGRFRFRWGTETPLR